jgi:hypothetical protein
MQVGRQQCLTIWLISDVLFSAVVAIHFSAGHQAQRQFLFRVPLSCVMPCANLTLLLLCRCCVLCLSAGVTAEDFQSQYAAGSLKAVSDISGVPASSIKSTVSSTGTSPASNNSSTTSTSSRRLLQQATTPAAAAAAASAGSASSGLTVAYSLAAADATAASEGLQKAAADNGAGLYAALDANGVPLRPAVRLNGATLVTQEQAAAAEANTRQQRGLRRDREDGWPLWKKLAVGLPVGIGGGLLLAMLVLGLCVCKKRHRIDQIKRHEAQLVAVDQRKPYPDAVASGGATEQQGGKQGKAVDLRWVLSCFYCRMLCSSLERLTCVSYPDAVASGGATEQQGGKQDKAVDLR